MRTLLWGRERDGPCKKFVHILRTYFGHLAKFVCSFSYHIGACMSEVPKIWERWGPRPLRWWRGWHHKSTPLPVWVDMPNWTAVGQIGQTVRSYVRRSAEKIGPIASRLSRSLKVVESDSDRSVTCDFLWPIATIRTYVAPFPRWRAISVEKRKFFLPPYLSARYPSAFITPFRLKRRMREWVPWKDLRFVEPFRHNTRTGRRDWYTDMVYH